MRRSATTTRLAAIRKTQGREPPLSWTWDVAGSAAHSACHRRPASKDIATLLAGRLWHAERAARPPRPKSKRVALPTLRLSDRRQPRGRCTAAHVEPLL